MRAPFIAVLLFALAIFGAPRFDRAVAQDYAGGTQMFWSWAPTGQAVLSASNTTGRVALGSAAPIAYVCNQSATVVAFVALGSVTVTASTTTSQPVQISQCISLAAAGSGYLAAITSSSTAALTISTGSGRP